MTEYKLQYFDSHGRGEPIRWLFHLAGVSFTDERLSPEGWAELKPSTPFGKVPLLSFDDQKIFGSMSILRYLARQFGLAGTTDLEMAHGDEIADVMHDLVGEYVTYFFEMDEDRKAKNLEMILGSSAPRVLSSFETILESRAEAGDGPAFFVTDGISWTDIYVSCWMNAMLRLDENILDAYPKLKELCDAVKSADGIREWIEIRPDAAI